MAKCGTCRGPVKVTWQLGHTPDQCIAYLKGELKEKSDLEKQFPPRFLFCPHCNQLVQKFVGPAPRKQPMMFECHKCNASFQVRIGEDR